MTELQREFMMIQDWAFDGYGIPLDVIVKLYHNIVSFSGYKVEVVPASVKYTEAPH